MKNMSLAMLARQIGVGVATVDRVLNERGGVSPQTTRKVLQAAREAGLKRILPEEHRFPRQIELFLSSNDSFFFPQLAQDFAAVADSLGYRRLTLHRTFVPESQPATRPGALCAAASSVRGSSSSAMTTLWCMTRCAAAGKRASPSSPGDGSARRRPALPRRDQSAAGWPHRGVNDGENDAAAWGGADGERPGGLQRASPAHPGFREVLSQRFPHLQLNEVLAGEERREQITRLLEQALCRSRHIVGIYNTGLGNTQIAEALARHRRESDVCWITHERYNTTRQQLARGSLALTLDQNTRQHAQLAIDLMLRHLESGYQPQTYADGKVDFILYSAENVD